MVQVEPKLDEENCVKYTWPYTRNDEKLTYKNIICVCEIEENDSNDTTSCDDDTQKAKYKVGRKYGKKYLSIHMKN